MFLRWANVNPSLYARVDRTERNKILMLALSIPISVITAVVVFYYFFEFITEYFIVSALLGVFIGVLMYLHDSSLLGEKGKTRAVIRLIFSVGIAIIAAIPLKVKIFGDSLTANYVQSIEAYNAGIDQEIIDAQQVIEDEEDYLDAVLQEASEEFDRTGKTQAMYQARKNLAAFKETKEERLQEIADLYEPKKKPLEPTKMDIAAYFFSNMFNNTSPQEMLGNLMIFTLLLVLEAFPAGVRLLLEEGKYLSKVAHQQLLKDRTDDEIEQIELSLIDLKNISDLDEMLDEVSIWKEMERASDNGFEDIDKLKSLVKSYKESKNPPPQQTSPPAKQQAHVPSSTNSVPNNAAVNGFAEFDYSK